MMEGAKLAAIFRFIFGRKYDNCLEDKIRLQKVIYALNECNMSCGNYAFMWAEHGPYSSELSNDMKRIDTNEKFHLCYDSSGRKALSKIKKVFTIIPPDVGYKEIDWIEALMSIHYIQNYILRTNNKGEVLAYLTKCKPYLSSDNYNNVAYNIAQEFQA